MNLTAEFIPLAQSVELSNNASPEYFSVLLNGKVCITRIAKARLYRARRPKYQVQPDNVRKVLLASNGKLSTNEA